MKFCFRLRHTAMGTFAKRVYGDSVLSWAYVFRWFKAFSEGQDSIEDESHNGRPSAETTDENVDRIRDFVRSDGRLTVTIIGEQLNLTRTTIHQVLTNELGMRKVCMKTVPKNLSQDQKTNRRETSLEFLERIVNDPHPHFPECH